MQKSKELGWYTLGHIPSMVGLDGVLAGGMNELSHIEGLIEDALRVLRLNREEYPADWNVCDSYGEACMKAGMKERTLESYERALALDPMQDNPRNMLRQLRQQ